MAGNIEQCLNTLEKNLEEVSTNPSLSSQFSSLKEQAYLKSTQYYFLGKAYEAQENKSFAVKYFKEALKQNSENIEAFDRLISNYLLTHEEKLHLIDEVKFYEPNVWLRDYYLSRIHQVFSDI